MAAQQRLASGAAWVNCDSLALFWSYEVVAHVCIVCIHVLVLQASHIVIFVLLSQASQDQYLTTVWNSALKFRGPEFIQVCMLYFSMLHPSKINP